MCGSRDAKAGVGTLTAVALAVLASGEVMAEAWQIEPFVKLQGEYDSNTRLVSSNEQSSTAAVLTGALQMSRITEISEISAEVRLDGVDYQEEEFEDELHQRYRMDAVWRGERSRHGVWAALERDTLLRTVEEIVDPGDISLDPDEDVDAALVPVDIRRDRLDLQPSWSYRTSELSEVGLRYRFRGVRYERDLPSLTEYDDHELAGSWSYRTTELDRLTTTLVASRYTADATDREYDEYQALVGWNHEFDELTEGGIQVGYYQAEWDNGADDEDDGYLVRLSGERDIGLTRFSGRVGRSIYPSGTGDLVRSDELALRMVHELSPRSNFSLRARVFENTSLRAANQSANRRYISVQPVLSWNMTRWWILEGSYQYERQKRDIDTDSAENHAVRLGVRYSFPQEL